MDRLGEATTNVTRSSLFSARDFNPSFLVFKDCT